MEGRIEQGGLRYVAQSKGQGAKRKEIAALLDSATSKRATDELAHFEKSRGPPDCTSENSGILTNSH